MCSRKTQLLLPPPVWNTIWPVLTTTRPIEYGNLDNFRLNIDFSLKCFIRFILLNLAHRMRCWPLSTGLCSSRWLFSSVFIIHLFTSRYHSVIMLQYCNGCKVLKFSYAPGSQMCLKLLSRQDYSFRCIKTSWKIWNLMVVRYWNLVIRWMCQLVECVKKWNKIRGFDGQRSVEKYEIHIRPSELESSDFAPRI